MKTKQDIADLMQRIFKELDETREAGQKEYAHSSDNAFGNFERLAAEMHLDRKQVLWIYLKKHLDGILSYINGHVSQREPVTGRIKDAIVYLILFWGMVEDDNQKPDPMANVQYFEPQKKDQNYCHRCNKHWNEHDLTPLGGYRCKI